jgi:acetylornithine deacetylase/succinyl-diaminopimelate desuccinylase-like protein
MATTNVEAEDWLKSSDSKEYFELLSFQSVGADPSRLRESAACATWLKKWLEKIGAEAKLLTRDFAPPVLFAEFKGAEGAPTALFYGHYDVQPPDPVEAWETPPFEPTLKGDRVYARGAQDDKGQFFAFLCGVREFIAANPGRLNLKIILEGQEESGSTALAGLLPEIGGSLAADVLLVCDSGAADDLRPAIVAGLRGVSHFTVRLTAAGRDLHSGEYGGIAPNAAQGMAELVASLHNPDGSIAVFGFRDGIEPPSHEESRLAEALSRSESELRDDIGCDPVGGQLGKTVAQRNGFEPTVEVNGIHSGYGGPGSKTVIPCEAVAKISMRLVPGQNPARCFAAVREHLESRVPRGMKMEITEVTGEAAGFRLPLASPIFRLAGDVLEGMDGRGAVFYWNGASIPIVSSLREISGAAPLLVGWGQSEDRIHSPNESFSVRQFEKAKRWAVEILSAL